MRFALSNVARNHRTEATERLLFFVRGPTANWAGLICSDNAASGDKCQLSLTKSEFDIGFVIEPNKHKVFSISHLRDQHRLASRNIDAPPRPIASRVPEFGVCMHTFP